MALIARTPTSKGLSIGRRDKGLIGGFVVETRCCMSIAPKPSNG